MVAGTPVEPIAATRILVRPEGTAPQTRDAGRTTSTKRLPLQRDEEGYLAEAFTLPSPDPVVIARTKSAASCPRDGAQTPTYRCRDHA
jgi:hypothetical protein